MTPNLSALSIADVLEAAAALIEPEGAWTQEAYAKSRTGNALIVGTHKDAVCWCILGALDKVSQYSIDNQAAWKAGHKILFRLLDGRPQHWNDMPGRTQAEAVAVLRSAASLAREQSA